MDNITSLLINSINKYFHTLSVFGYKDYDSVNKLILLSFIEELLAGELSIFLNEEDYKSVTKCLYCICGKDCMINFPSYNSNDSIIHPNIVPLTPRISENCIIRVDEDNLMRKI